ncbi:MAG: hypothetical protein Edafosvirus20_20 [Edafosvirus sp.]|uniref:Uncharacterized protein n=1 Tax=Edafosvirus sp. TaxID=2487765 RepID=A0A3G4ZUS9_9VIRU|nr:MAG: hypothetical protein Edafosvirus20_20 [Edafosvirus sp.]
MGTTFTGLNKHKKIQQVETISETSKQCVGQIWIGRNAHQLTCDKKISIDCVYTLFQGVKLNADIEYEDICIDYRFDYNIIAHWPDWTYIILSDTGIPLFVICRDRIIRQYSETNPKHIFLNDIIKNTMIPDYIKDNETPRITNYEFKETDKLRLVDHEQNFWYSKKNTYMSTYIIYYGVVFHNHFQTNYQVLGHIEYKYMIYHGPSKTHLILDKNFIKLYMIDRYQVYYLPLNPKISTEQFDSILEHVKYAPGGPGEKKAHDDFNEKL